jgi:phosphoserine phosphatase RsbU/P
MATTTRTRAAFWKSMPRTSRALFYGGVFALFASIGLITLLMANHYLARAQILLTVVTSGGFAIFYAWSGVTRRLWLLPVFGVAEVFVFSWVGNHYHYSIVIGQSGTPVQNQIISIASLAILAVVAGYVLFTVFFRLQGARYFRAQTEIALASEIHRALVPPIHQTLGCYELFGASYPSGEVGGDLVDVTGDANSWTAYVADVSGHGVSAGLLMAMFKTAVRTRALDIRPDVLLREVHRALYPLKTNNMFVTAGFLGCTGDQLTLSLAGHPALLRYCSATGSVEEHPTLDLPLGILPEQTFAAQPLACQAGDILLLLTDGLTEVFDKHRNEMGIGPIKTALAKSASLPLPDIFTTLRHVALQAGHQEDDQTMLLVRKT